MLRLESLRAPPFCAAAALLAGSASSCLAGGRFAESGFVFRRRPAPLAGTSHGASLRWRPFREKRGDALRSRPCRSSSSLFPSVQVPPHELQAMMRRDIRRRFSELLALGWLGRLYLFVPFLFRRLFPKVFRLESYEDEKLCFEQAGVVQCTLRESSVVPRGAPFTFRLRRGGKSPERITEASLLGIGCELLPNAGGAPMSSEDVRALCDVINEDLAAKRLLVRTMVRTIFTELSQVGGLCRAQEELVPCCDVVEFSPRQELFAQEGTSKKWLQKVSGYYFAKSSLQQVRFASGAENVIFTFYFDATEPVNSENPRANINPEAIGCKFLCP